MAVLSFIRRKDNHAAGRTGAEGEDAVAHALTLRGWRILDRNWRSGHVELDIVCLYEGVVIFVEVKTRASGSIQRPDEALTPVKKRHLLRAAQVWLTEHKAWSRPCRFDLACVTVQDGMYQTELIHNVIEYGENRNAVGDRYTSWQPW